MIQRGADDDAPEPAGERLVVMQLRKVPECADIRLLDGILSIRRRVQHPEGDRVRHRPGELDQSGKAPQIAGSRRPDGPRQRLLVFAHLLRGHGSPGNVTEVEPTSGWQRQFESPCRWV